VFPVDGAQRLVTFNLFPSAALKMGDDSLYDPMPSDMRTKPAPAVRALAPFRRSARSLDLVHSLSRGR
jgi:hypothetical protein